MARILCFTRTAKEEGNEKKKEKSSPVRKEMKNKLKEMLNAKKESFQSPSTTGGGE